MLVNRLKWLRCVNFVWIVDLCSLNVFNDFANERLNGANDKVTSDFLKLCHLSHFANRMFFISCNEWLKLWNSYATNRLNRQVPNKFIESRSLLSNFFEMVIFINRFINVPLVKVKERMWACVKLMMFVADNNLFHIIYMRFFLSCIYAGDMVFVCMNHSSCCCYYVQNK